MLIMIMLLLRLLLFVDYSAGAVVAAIKMVARNT